MAVDAAFEVVGPVDGVVVAVRGASASIRGAVVDAAVTVIGPVDCVLAVPGIL